MPDKLTSVTKETYLKAQECYAAKNYDCAIDSSKAVIKMDPGNNEAQQLLKQAKDDFLAYRVSELQKVANKCLKNEDVQCASKKLQRLIDIAAGSEQIVLLESMISEKKLEIFIRESMQRANTCLQEKDYDCVMDYTAQLLSREPDYKPAKDLANNVRAILSRQRIATANNNKKFNSRIKQSKACFRKEDYVCAKKHAKLALQNKPDNSQAETLYEKSSYALNRKADNLRRANKVLKQGKKCFERKNYSCSIAKSESALEFVPGHKAALKLKNKAKNEIEKLRNSIIIN